MAARAGRARNAAGWAISLGLHLLFAVAVLLTPAAKILAPPAIELKLVQPDFYSPLRPTTRDEAEPASRQPAATPAASPLTSRPPPALPASVPAAPPVTPNAPLAAISPLPQAAQPNAPTPATRPAGPPAGPADGASQAAVNVLRQTFGCSSGMRQILTIKEQAECERRAADRAKDIPDRPGDTIPKYKRDYYDAVVAARNSPNHIPGTDCVAVARSAGGRAASKNGPPVNGVVFERRCVDPPGAGPKPPPVTLQDLGLAR